MNVLLSIKPRFADRILDGEKRYEFRKAGFRDTDLVETVLMYASAPVQKIVGYFTVGDVITTRPEELWERFGSQAGTSKDQFMNYFEQSETGHAIQVEDPSRLPAPIDPRQYVEEFHPPVSFKYTDDEFERMLEDRVPI